MIDREKVAKGLKCLKQGPQNGVCGDCVYFRPFTDDPDCGLCDTTVILDDAIALLQGQKRARWILDRLHHYKCSACGAQWGLAPLNMNYCPTCGRYMEGRDPDDCRYAQDVEEEM